MIGLLKSNLLLSPFVLFVLAFLLRIKGLINPVGYTLNGNEGPLYMTFHSFLQNPYVESIFVSLIIFVQAYLVNRLVLNHNLMRPPSFLPAFFFLILASLSAQFLGFHPVILANVFIILGISELFKIYKLHKSAIHIFNGGFFFAIAGLIYFPVFVFYLACSIIILVLRSYSIVERLQLVFGFLVPIYLILIWHFLNDNLADYISTYMQITFKIPSWSGVEANNFYVLIFFLILMVLSILNYRNFIIKKGIEIQKKIDSLFWVSLFSLFALFFASFLDLNHIILLAFPLSVFLSMIILNLKHSVVAEFIGLVMLSAVPIFHYVL